MDIRIPIPVHPAWPYHHSSPVRSPRDSVRLFANAQGVFEYELVNDD